MTTIKGTIRYRDKGLNEIIRKLKIAGQMAGAVGVMGQKAAETHPLRNNITVGEVAIINEYGSKAAGVPRRSYLRSTFDENRSKLLEAMRDGISLMIKRDVGPREVFHHAGEIMAELVRKKIASGDVPPEDAPKTIKEKGHDNTLINTRTLLQAIDNAVHEHREGATIITSGPSVPEN